MSKKDPQTFDFEDVDGNEQTFRSTPFAAIKAYELMPDVMDLVGQPLTHLLDGSETSSEMDLEDVEVEGSALQEAIASLTSFLREKGDIDWILRLLGDTYLCTDKGSKDKCLGERAHFNTTFQADMILLAKVVFKIIQINYAGSLAEKLKDGSGKLQSLLSEFQSE